MEATVDISRAGFINAMRDALEILSLYDEGAFETAMTSAMGRIAEAAGADRLILFRYPEYSRSASPSVILRWDGKKHGAEISDANLFPGLRLSNIWKERLSRNELVCLCYSEMEEDIQDYMIEIGVKLLLLSPIIIGGMLWGALTLHKGGNERKFEAGIIDLLNQVFLVCKYVIIA